jgi:hypothetical protein
MQGGRAVRLFRVHVRFLLQKGSNRRLVLLGFRIGKRRARQWPQALPCDPHQRGDENNR